MEHTDGLFLKGITISILRRYCLPAGLLIAAQLAVAQETEEYELKQLRDSEARRHSGMVQLSKGATPGQEGFDVTYYKLDLRLSINPNGISGSVTLVATVIVDNLTSITLDLMNSLAVDAVSVGGVQATFTRQATFFTIPLSRPYARGEKLTVVVSYHGVPGSSGFGSFVFTTDSTGSPWVWSLSEPYGAKDWWPCKDHPSDKADSLDLWMTVPVGLKVGSQGSLVSSTANGDGTVTYKWRHRYPIPTYLVSIAAANYSEASAWFRYSPTDSMVVLNYALPTMIASARNSLPLTIGMLQIFSDLFGLYPFVTEKYGHSQFGWGGGMEHQTMTSLVNFGENLVAHELAHQWFGDMITMRTWPDIWLNEGFATYSVALYQEKKYGKPAYTAYTNSQMASALTATGTVFVQDTSNVSRLFSHSLVYAKGATVLHMLRHVMGDSLFFKAIRQYALDPRFRFGTASTGDFQSVCESVYGKSLEYFFRQWIYGEKYPKYRYEWGTYPTGSTHRVRISVFQTTGTANPTYFTMPIDFRISGAGLDTTVTVINDAPSQWFVFEVSKPPAAVQLDPGNWILKDATAVPVGADNSLGPPQDFALLQNYPNPFNSTTTIPFELPVASVVRIGVFNLLGELIRVVSTDNVFEAGRHTVSFQAVGMNGSPLPSGVYYYRLSAAGSVVQTRTMLYLR